MSNVRDFARFKAEHRKISIVTAYDAWSAQLVERSTVDAILVGDSVAMVMHGHRTTVPATVAMMALHTAAVARVASNKFLIADLPFLSYRNGVSSAMRAVGAPVNRILWSVQAGVVLAAGGLGLWFAKASVIEEAAQALNVVAVLAVALGVGFVASALVAYGLSRQLGLLESEPRSTHA